MSHETESILQQVVDKFVHRLFPSFVEPGFIACPDKHLPALLDAMTQAVAARGVTLEMIDLRPAPGELLDRVTVRIVTVNRQPQDTNLPPNRLLVLVGFDLLEGRKHDEPTYPFRSDFQFDRHHLWLFVGRNRNRLARLFHSRKLPLYLAARDLTPAEWR
ncbi:hypothetical protein [Novilysobacter arseniciresistens]|uniref:hypothetical protein n=1 Tax=Novilysobacter arseniciresistens TaxID=1385522 RepID=UPI00126A35AC|nr:hypothetical protein [Lysobacter arseniciresistens]